MRAVVTGGRGWLGSNLVDRLRRDGWEATVIDITPLPADPDKDGIIHMLGDVSDPAVLGDTIDSSTDVVFHLAYLLGPEGQSNIHKALRINCHGTANVFDAAMAAECRAVWLSSSAIYGPAAPYGEESISEEDLKAEPRLIYGSCKRFNEQVARALHREGGLDHVGFRLSFGYGPPARSHGYSTAVTALFEGSFREEEVDVTFPDVVQNWAYVDDVVDGLMLGAGAESPRSRIYNLSSDVTLTPLEVGEALQKKFPGVSMRVLLDGAGEWPARLDYSLAREELGYVPKFDLEAGIESYRQAVLGGSVGGAARA